MNLIKKIEINYLRSIYSATLNRIGDINIIFGRNDSGKSNILRSLNLFFNDRIDAEYYDDHDYSIEFDIDFSDIRRNEAQKAKGRQFIWIKLTFSVPENFRNSLGHEITIKRQWNRDGNVTETIWPHDLTSGQAAQLTKFRNQIDFTYIPAVKDLEVYADLIERMYGAAAETPALQSATNAFVDAIQGQTTELSHQLTKLFENPARLAPPTEMSRLFRALDFAHGEEGHSLLRQKGDGVKARHLPELLRFINENEHGKKHFIWAFEEPENSLDLGAAEAEARRFAEFASRRDTQIFITSHSPAFYLASPDRVAADTKRFFITKQIPNPESGAMSPPDAAALLGSLEEAERKMENAGIMQLPFVIRSLKELQEENAQLADEREQLQSRLSKLERPTLFVEGKHDKALFSDALCRVGLEDGQFDIQPLNGTPTGAAELLKAVCDGGLRLGDVASFFLFDNDKRGRRAYRSICRAGPTEQPYEFGSKMAVWTLPMIKNFIDFLESMGIEDDKAFFTAEFLFPSEHAARLCKDLVEERCPAGKPEIQTWRKTIHGDYWSSLSQEKSLSLLQAPEGEPAWLYARGVPESLKERYTQEAMRRGLSTVAVDEVAKVIAEHLTRPR